MLIGLPISIIGAGIGGLALATALAQRGAQVTVYEQAAALKEVGAGLQISPNGTAVLAGLGLGADVLGAGVQSQAVELRDYRAGRQVLRMDLARDYSGVHPFVMIHRARLLDLLAAAARQAGVTINLGAQAQAAELSSPLIIGADGVKSATRALLNGAEQPFFTGQTAWRAVIADSTNVPPEAHIYMGPGRHLVTYPLADGLRNIVAVQERADWAAEGWSHPDDPANLRAAFAGFAPQVKGWLDQVTDCNLWGLFRHDIAKTWQNGRIAILGDAAHPTLPFLAQGANLALEDAWVLADCLATHPQAEALELYQTLRAPRVIRAITAANGNARNYHLRNPLIRGVAHTGLRIGGKLAPKAALAKFRWLYDHDVTRVSA